MELRSWQKHAKIIIERVVSSNDDNIVVVNACVGSGKTLVAEDAFGQFIKNNENDKTIQIFVTPRIRLCDQQTTSIANALNDMYGADIKYCSNRKEVKDHGDKGILLGSPISDGDKVVIIEDVTTAGTSIGETLPIIKAQGDVTVKGLVVSVDRMERGTGTKSALKQIAEDYGMETTAIVTMAEVVEHLYNKPYKGQVIIDDTIKAAIDAYYEQYGAKN